MHNHRYSGQEIEVLYDHERCIHTGECLRRLPQVFNQDQKPWVTPDHGTADKVAEAVMACPTGALRFVRKDGVTEPVPLKNLCVVQPHSALYLSGDLEIIQPGSAAPLKETRAALCRCGGSANKPFCDDHHIGRVFRDTGRIGAHLETVIAAPASGKLVITLIENGPLEIHGRFELRGTFGTSACLQNAALCRCGESGNKPFCDGSHRLFDFNSED
jgi:CDGSH-type Zn-finger protein/uncharacterized Fe-S cluster protein YjdI